MTEVQQVTRAEVADAVEVGICHVESLYGGLLTSADADALRHVARTAPRVAVGAYFAEGIGCPMVQAFERWGALEWDVAFVSAFDLQVKSGCVSRTGAFVAEVT